jgi:hypothetical protein
MEAIETIVVSLIAFGMVCGATNRIVFGSWW